MSTSNFSPSDTEVLASIAEILEARKKAEPQSSYVASLYNKGMDAILKKVGEEAVETILAAKSETDEQLIYETADLWFHTMIMLAHRGLGPAPVLAELQRRFGVSGLVEKQSRR